MKYPPKKSVNFKNNSRKKGKLQKIYKNKLKTFYTSNKSPYHKTKPKSPSNP